MSLKRQHRLASGKEVLGNFKEYLHQHVSQRVSFSTNLLRVPKYL